MKKFRLIDYILPSVISMVIVGTYTNIDGLFIGNRAGDDGLAAINIAWPIVAFITSVGTGLGIGASVVINGLRGKNEALLAERAKTSALWLLLAAGVFWDFMLWLVRVFQASALFVVLVKLGDTGFILSLDELIVQILVRQKARLHRRYVHTKLL